MKKQFFRVKQLAEQNFLGSSKSDVFNSNELVLADQKVEYVKGAVTNITKKIPAGTPGLEFEKKLKKQVEYQLAQVLNEQADKINEDGSEFCPLFQKILKSSADIEKKLAQQQAEHECKVEEMVGGPLQKLVDLEFPNLTKQKRHITKYLLDRDSASNRYNSTKKETLKDDMDEADTKVEQNRDALATEMFGLLARENELSTYILQYLKLQRGYHESALKDLQEIIPGLEKEIGDSSIKKVFGVSLQEHLRVTNKKLAYPLEICINFLTETGMSEEGLFRIVGGSSKVKRLKAAIDSGCITEYISEYKDVHVLASTLKLYLRELPEPLLTSSLLNEWINSMSAPENQKIDSVKSLIKKLPQENQDNLAYLIQFLAKLSHHPENKMTSSNIAIVISPNLIWTNNEETNMNMSIYSKINMLVELFIKEVNVFFPDDVSKYVSLPKTFLEDRCSINNFKADSNHVEYNVSSESIVSDSPKPNTRKKKTAAPVPPNTNSISSNISKTDQDISTEKATMASPYPSGSLTLNRPHKSKEQPKIKASIGINTVSTGEKHLHKTCSEETDTHNKTSDLPKPLVNINDPTVVADHKYVTQQAANIQVSKAIPVKPVQAQNTENENNFKTTAVHQIVHKKDDKKECSRPVAAPRSIVNQEGEKNVNLSRNSSIRSENTSSFGGEVQLRKPEALERVSKPEVPARPASLQKRSSADMDLGVLRTQCSVQSVAPRQQPSFVNITNKNDKYLPGHDNQIAEKEKFLGHQPDKILPLPRASLENKFSDINSNCSTEDKTSKPCGDSKPRVLPKSLNLTKSNEKLNVTKSQERINESEIYNGNQKPSHVRTRSDGNIIDLSGDHSVKTLLQTPPSPRSLNKPTQPPPPPPVAATTAITTTTTKPKEPDSTDL